MIYEVKQSKDITEVERGGHYNVCPPNWAPITEHEFVRGRHFDIPKYIEFRQVAVKKDDTPSDNKLGRLLSVVLFWSDRWHGFAMSTDYYPGAVKYFKFGYSKEEITEMLKEEFPPIVKDTGWGGSSSSIPNRGIHDYNRQITFERELESEELQKVCEWLAKVNCPGYTGVTGRLVSKQPHRLTYGFSTTYDSSD